MSKVKKDYSNLEKEQLIEIIKQLENSKQYGLVWSTKRVPEKVVEDSKTMLPVLVEDESKSLQEYIKEHHDKNLLGGIITNTKTLTEPSLMITSEPNYNYNANDWAGWKYISEIF